MPVVRRMATPVISVDKSEISKTKSANYSEKEILDGMIQ